MKRNSVINIENYTTISGKTYQNLPISFEMLGCELFCAPTVIVFHALTGNADVASESAGWWKGIIGKNRVIDLDKYTVISFNLLGNGADNFYIENYRDFVARDMALLAKNVLTQLNISFVYAIVGGSLGGGIAWEMVTQFPTFASHLIAVASHCKSNQWLQAICHTQESILHNSKHPIEDARKVAMLFYRAAGSINQKFPNDRNKSVVSWLNYHGNQLKDRFSLKSYLLMNQLLSSIQIFRNNSNALHHLSTNVVQIGISTDLLFPKEDLMATDKELESIGKSHQYFEITSPHGHDAFLIEINSITQILKHYF